MTNVGLMGELADYLLAIERELRIAGLWSVEPPSAQALASEQPFCVDTLAFEQWLQWVLLPRMKVLLEKDLPLPGASGVAEMAEIAWAARAGSLAGVMRALQDFDRLLTARA